MLTCPITGGSIRHGDVCWNLLRELKEEGPLRVMWCSGDQNSSDLFTKNLQVPLFEKHAATYVSG